jgi:aminopeptidase N/puromycin-sensitive aminopeptidase
MHPEWNIDQTVISDLDQTLILDAQPTTRAIRAHADTREEIEQMFDGISYGKASDVLLTVENYLGEETFRQGVHNYLAAHEYGNATAEDFWGAQTATSHKPVDKIMESLVAQPGEPLITFGIAVNGKVAVAQRRFFFSPSIVPDPAQKWTLPVCFKTASGQDCQVLSLAETELKAPAGSAFANAGGMGYYRSAYPASVYAALVAQVESTLTPSERISLIGDEWAQVRANTAAIGDYLDLASAVKADPGAEVVDEAISGVNTAYTHIAASADERAGLSAWIRSTYAPVYAKLGPPAESDSSNTRELRAELFGLLGHRGQDPAVLAQAREISARYLADPGSVEATLGQAALSVAARHGDAALFDQLQQVYETSTNPEFQEGALRLLTQFENPALVQRSLDYALSGKVRNQDSIIQFAIALRIDENRDRAWKYIQDNWEKVQTQLTPEMGGFLVRSTGNFCSADARASVEKFFAAHKVPAADQSLKHALESIDGCIELRKLQEPKLKQWLAAQPKP